MPSIARFCEHCKKYSLIEVVNGKDLICNHCQVLWCKIDLIENCLERCPMCTCRQFYTDKDFNQMIGFIVMAVGIILVPFTFGLSLPFFAFIDWIIYKKVSKMVVCYRCGSEFRDFLIPERLRPFTHPIGLKYDKYR